MSENNAPDPFVVGQSYCLFVPAGWLIAATCSKADKDYVYFVDVVQLESVKAGHAMIDGVCSSKSKKDLDKALDRYWPMPDGCFFRREAILMAFPAQMKSFRCLSRSKEGAAIDSAA